MCSFFDDLKMVVEVVTACDLESSKASVLMYETELDTAMRAFSVQRSNECFTVQCISKSFSKDGDSSAGLGSWIVQLEHFV